jgi:hypothetical protein
MNRDEKLSTIIELCKDIDGCTLGYILRSIGMEEQMLRQLVMRYPQSDTIDLLNEKVELDDQRLSNYQG